MLQQFKDEEKREIQHVQSCLERVDTFLRREMTNVLSLVLDDNTIKTAHQIRLDAEVLISGKSQNHTESSTNKPFEVLSLIAFSGIRFHTVCVRWLG